MTGTVLCPRCTTLPRPTVNCSKCKQWRQRAEDAANRQPELPMPKEKIIELKFHPLAELFPLMEGEEFEAFADDIEANGQRDPIWLLNGDIIDGRNRYLACKDRGIDPRTEDYKGTDALGFVLSKNLHRRHLTTSQRALIAEKVSRKQEPANLPVSPTSEDQLLVEQDESLTQAEAAKALKVSERQVRNAKKLQGKAVPDLVKMVAAGTITMNMALRVCALSHAQQQKLVDKGATAIRVKAKSMADAAKPPKATGVPKPTKAERQKAKNEKLKAQAALKDRERMIDLIATRDEKAAAELRGNLLIDNETLLRSVPLSCKKCWKQGPPKNKDCLACESLRNPFTMPEAGGTPDSGPHAELRRLATQFSGLYTKAVNDTGSEFNKRLHDYSGACGILDHPPEKRGKAVFLPLKGVALILEWASKEGPRRTDADVKEAYDTASGGWIPPATERRRKAKTRGKYGAA